MPKGVSLPLGLALGSPIFPSGCEGKLGVALESLQGEEGNPAGLSSCSGGLRPLVELCVEPAGLCGRCTGVAAESQTQLND